MGCLRARNEAFKGQSLYLGVRGPTIRPSWSTFACPDCFALSQAMKLGAMSHVHEFFMSFSTIQSLARVRRHAFALLLGGDHELPQGSLRGRL